jgi:hypothetical protein
MKLLLFSLMGIYFQFLCQNVALAQQAATFWGEWKVDKSWNRDMEMRYSHFIAFMGSAVEKRLCRNLAECLRSPLANPLWQSEDSKWKFEADCADMPYILRAYFSYRNKLPFAFMSWENSHKERVFSFEKLIPKLRNLVSTENFIESQHAHLKETYPVTVRKEFVRPGTHFYDPDGHVLVVYRINADGSVFLFDSQPNGIMGVKRFPHDLYEPGLAQKGGGFRNWRPLKIIESEALSKRSLAEVPFIKNDEIDNFDKDEQYQSKFLHKGSELDYWPWVRQQLAVSDARIRPQLEFRARLSQLCDDISERISAVDLATKARIFEIQHPAKLPKNIYRSSDPTWEIYASPSRDMRLRASIRAIKRFALNTVLLVKMKRMNFLNYQGTFEDLEASYARIWNEKIKDSACQFKYQNSQQQATSINLVTFVKRAYQVSFDPYHCAEMRWGASPFANDLDVREEYKSCKKDAQKEGWYVRQQTLRNVIDRNSNDVPKTSLQDQSISTEDLDLNQLFQGKNSTVTEK